MQKSVVYDKLKSTKSIFFVGIGGVSMASLARYARSKGYAVRGSDSVESEEVRRLISEGFDVVIGHSEDSVSGADLVVYTAAVGEDNPELAGAKKLGIQTASRAQFLGAVMADYRVRIGVSGSHGKSTATAMISDLMLFAKKNPTVMCGASVPGLGGAYRVGEKDFLFEACEYRDSFLSLYPNVAVILNVDLDHTDYFKDMDSLIASFSKFAKISSDDGGSVIVCADDDGAVTAAENEFAITFGIERECDYRAKDIVMTGGFASFSVERCDEPFIERITLSVPGRHNIYNALSAVTVGDLIGVKADDIARSLSNFRGISRRFEKIKSYMGADIYVDYAHHPREIEETIKTARSICRGRLITLFEPHTYSRTKALFDGFARAFDAADEKLFVDIYAARERDDGTVTSKMLADAAGGEYSASYSDAAQRIGQICKDGDTVLILGAGTVNKVADMIGG
ncbi:MAG: UDP-N-acetylmuramate--L-alanine ligase [Clostridia bacterium]|nr:UDP-N-acetylmuramate--L-alanine ligase [Clostridia bacterium]